MIGGGVVVGLYGVGGHGGDGWSFWLARALVRLGRRCA